MDIQKEILATTGAEGINNVKLVQTLWSGYGELKRYFLEGGHYSSVIVKHIQLPKNDHHPRGWNTNRSHQRKLTSYQVERQWYQTYAQHTNNNCRVPQSLQVVSVDNELLLVMEDLDAAGYNVRHEPGTITLSLAKNCLSWLAAFHALFMGSSSAGLWEQGTYWHLDTRPDELESMKNENLKQAAYMIDQKLKNARYQTIVHGDAKLANFCFCKSGDASAVDFQYVGRGCGMKDVAYFISSCFDEATCEKYEDELLGHYFKRLEMELPNTRLYQSVKDEWYELYRYAWADLYRFLDGWSPGHWKMHQYSEKLTERVLNEISKN